SRESGDGDVVGGAIRYAVMHAAVSTAVVGVMGTDELVRNCRAVQNIAAPNDRWCDEVAARVASIDARECTRCGDCVTVCPEHINIAKVLRSYDQHRFFGMRRMAAARYRRLDVDASACERCRKCVDVCPEKFDIAATLADAHRVLAPAAPCER